MRRLLLVPLFLTAPLGCTERGEIAREAFARIDPLPSAREEGRDWFGGVFALGDLDGDGFDDLLVNWFGFTDDDAGGIFSEHWSLFAGPLDGIMTVDEGVKLDLCRGARSPAVVDDLDGDGLPELLVRCGSGDVETVAPSGEVLGTLVRPAGRLFEGPAVGCDLDGDGLQEVVATSAPADDWTRTSARVYPGGLGDRSGDEPQTILGAGWRPQCLDDADGDGLPDLRVDDRVWLSGAGGITDAPVAHVTLPAPTPAGVPLEGGARVSYQAWDLGDVTGDGLTDLAVADFPSSQGERVDLPPTAREDGAAPTWILESPLVPGVRVRDEGTPVFAGGCVAAVGEVASGGDVDGDGTHDWLVGFGALRWLSDEPTDDCRRRKARGRILALDSSWTGAVPTTGEYLDVEGGRHWVPASSDLLMGSRAHWASDGLGRGSDNVEGRTLGSTGDLDADGRDSVWAWAPGSGPGQRGSIYLLDVSD